jgi:hypothetical protein
LYLDSSPAPLLWAGFLVEDKVLAKETQTPLYAALLDVSVAECFFLDMVHKLSYDRWCSKSIDHCAEDIGLSRSGMIKMRRRLLVRSLLKKNMRGHLKVTPVLAVLRDNCRPGVVAAYVAAWLRFKARQATAPVRHYVGLARASRGYSL